MSNHLKARNVPAIQGHLPSGSRDLLATRLALASPTPVTPVLQRPGSAAAPVTSTLTSPGPSWCNLTAPSAASPGPWLAVLQHRTPPGQLSPAALMHLSGRRQARKRPTAARRREAPTRLSAPELCSAQQPPCTPAPPAPSHTAASVARGSLAPRRPLLPAGPLSSHPSQLETHVARSSTLSELRTLKMEATKIELPKGRVLCGKVL